MNLFYCYGVANKLMGLKNVEVMLLQTAGRRELGQTLPYEVLIDGYHSMSEDQKMYAEGAVDEHFQLHEVEQLREFMHENFDMDISFEEVELPLPSDLMATGWMPAGGSIQIFNLCPPGGSLPWPFDFKVNLFFDRRNHEDQQDLLTECKSAVASVTEKNELPENSVAEPVTKVMVLPDCLMNDKKQIIAPVYGRKYVWDHEQLQPFWQRIEIMLHCRELSMKAPFYDLGTIILRETGRVCGRTKLLEVVDGRQRLMTLQILLACIRNFAKSGYVDIQSDVESYLFHPSVCFSDYDDPEILRYLPEDCDCDDLVAIINDAHVKGRKSKFPKTKSRVFAAYRYFNEMILNMGVHTNTGTVLRALMDVIRDNFIITEQVVICDQHDAIDMFLEINSGD